MFPTPPSGRGGGGIKSVGEEYRGVKRISLYQGNLSR